MRRPSLFAATAVAAAALCFIGGGARAHLNLFMNGTETKRLLGIPGELFYVRQGIVNEYALSFNIPIKSDVKDIYFAWQSLHKSPPEPLMYYSLSASSSNAAVLAQPVPSISLEGIVPTSSSVFSIRLPCTGLASGEVDVRIQLNITIFSTSNITVLDFRRKKICLKADYQASDADDGSGGGGGVFGYVNESSSSLSSARDARGGWATGGSASGAVFYIAVGSAVGTVFLITLTAVACFLRGKKPASANIYDNSVAQPLTSEKTYGKSDSQSNRSVISAGVHAGTATVYRATSSASAYAELRPVEVRNALREVQINPNAINFSEVLLEGTFGRIYRGTVVIGSGDCTTVQNVIIKTVTEEARHDQVDVMLRDALMLKGVAHDNVSSVTMVTSVDQAPQPPLLLYTDSGAARCNLKRFLQHCKVSEVLSAQQLVYMAVQIARGVQQLHRRRIVHRDLAARNCLVDGQLHVQVSDSALSRDVFPNDYHCLGDNENRPVKWLAFEALVARNFSAASDMWSFGMTVWELFTLGQQPYAEIDPFEMASYLEGGYRVTQPHNCPSDLFSIMACCWCLSPDERPRFTRMLTCLQDFYTALGRFV